MCLRRIFPRLKKILKGYYTSNLNHEQSRFRCLRHKHPSVLFVVCQKMISKANNFMQWPMRPLSPNRNLSDDDCLKREVNLFPYPKRFWEFPDESDLAIFLNLQKISHPCIDTLTHHFLGKEGQLSQKPYNNHPFY